MNGITYPRVNTTFLGVKYGPMSTHSMLASTHHWYSALVGVLANFSPDHIPWDWASNYFLIQLIGVKHSQSLGSIRDRYYVVINSILS